MIRASGKPAARAADRLIGVPPAEPRELPILFSAPMVLAILAGTKTVTRRVLTAPKSATLHGRRPLWDEAFVDPGPSPAGNHGPYLQLPITGGDMAGDRIVDRVYPRWQVGDTLWVRETWRTFERQVDGADGISFRADDAFVAVKNTLAAADLWIDAHENGKHGESWRPSIFMRRWASRITLEVVGIAVERLQNITEEQAKAEGVSAYSSPDTWLCIPKSDGGAFEVFVEPDAEDRTDLEFVKHQPGRELYSARQQFELLWNGINGKRASWASNPWVVAVSFKRVQS